MNLALLTELFAVIGPVFIIAGIGFCWGKSGRAFDTNQMAPIITFIGTPCLILSTLLKVNLSITTIVEMSMIAASAIAIFGVAGYFILRIFNLPYRPYLPSLMFSNGGNMGLPLCLFAFGEKGLALGVAYYSVLAIGQFTIGQALASGHASLIKLLKTPLVWAIILALILITTNTQLPRWTSNTINLLGQFTIPLMILTLGISLSRLQVKNLNRSGAMACLRIFGGYAVGYLLTILFGLEGIAKGVVIIQAGMPVAVFNYLFAQLHDNRPTEVAGMIVLSTVLSFITLPFILIFLL